MPSEEIPYDVVQALPEPLIPQRQSHREDKGWLRDKLKQILSEHATNYKYTICDDDTAADIGMDSLDQIEFLMHIEEFFETEIPDEDSESCTTFGQLVELVARLTKK